MKYDLIAEAYVALLIEGRIDDLKSQNPHLVKEIDSYANSDPTPQKKFVPWLVSQHKKGNVTPNDPSLNQTLSGFETYKSRHGIRDHSSKSYQEIKDAVQPFLGTAATNKEQKQKQIHEGIDQIYSSPDNKIQVFHVKTKEASQHVYGGGKELGGLHTDWCVSARSKSNRFGKEHGSMYTIHVNGDKKSPYAVHPRDNTITDRDNSGDVNIDDFLKNNKYFTANIDAIKQHYKNNMPIEDKIASGDDRVTDDDLSNALDDSDDEYRLEAISHKNIKPIHIDKALTDTYYMVRTFAAQNPNATISHLFTAMGDSHPLVRAAAMNNPNAIGWHIDLGLNDKDSNVVRNAASHPNATESYIDSALHYRGEDWPKVIKAAVTNKNATKKNIETALQIDHPELQNFIKTTDNYKKIFLKK